MALFNSFNFDPQSFSGILGALGLLKQGGGFNAPMDISPQGPIGQMAAFPSPSVAKADQSLQQQALPPQAQPVQYQPQQQFQPPGQLPGLFERLQAGATNFTSGGNPIAGLINSIGGFATGVRTDQQGVQMQMARNVYDALVPKLGPQGAMLAASNPQLWAQTRPKFGVVGQNQLGISQYGFIDPVSQTVKTANPTGATGIGGAIDPNLTGDAFLKAVSENPQLGPGKAALIKAIAEGKQPYPTGYLLKTPFGQWLVTALGQYEPGVDATTIQKRATFNRQMGSATPGSVGGQKTLMGTSLGHLAEVADRAVELNNSNGWGIAPLGQLMNYAKNKVSTENAAVANALNETVDRFSGEVGKLYSGSAGGGVTERAQTKSRFGESMTPAQAAGALEASRDLILSKLLALENQQDQIFGPDSKNRVDFLGENGRAALAKINEAIARLKGIQPAQATPTTAPQSVTLPQGWKLRVH